MPAAARPAAIDEVAWAASSAPSTETPIAPPRLRKNAISELAGADVALADGVLDDEHEVLHQHADAGADERP